MQKVTGTAGGGLGTRCWFHDDDDGDDYEEEEGEEEEDDDHHHHRHHTRHLLNTLTQLLGIHPKSGSPGSPDSANYLNFPQNYSLRTRKLLALLCGIL